MKVRYSPTMYGKVYGSNKYMYSSFAIEDTDAVKTNTKIKFFALGKLTRFKKSWQNVYYHFCTNLLYYGNTGICVLTWQLLATVQLR